jgi:hypothetical protein
VKNIKSIVAATSLTLFLNGCLGMAPSAWSDAGFKSVRSSDRGDSWNSWKHYGYTPQEAKKWRSQGFHSDNRWKDAGYTPQEAKIFIKYKASISNANSFKPFHLSPDELKIYLIKFNNNSDRISYLKAGVTPQELKDGFPTSSAWWFNHDLTKEDVKNWGNFNLSLRELKQLSRKKIKPEEYKKYIGVLEPTYVSGTYNLQFSATITDNILYAIENNISAKDLKDIKQVLKENNIHASSPTLFALAISNIKLQYIVNYYFAPNSILKDKQKLKKLLISCRSVEGKLLSKSSPFSTAGKCYVYNGKVTAVKNAQTVEIKECVKTDNQFDNCLDGRVSLMKFNKRIPDSMRRGSRYKGIIKSQRAIKTFLYGNSSKNTELILPVVEE